MRTSCSLFSLLSLSIYASVISIRGSLVVIVSRPITGFSSSVRFSRFRLISNKHSGPIGLRSESRSSLSSEAEAYYTDVSVLLHHSNRLFPLPKNGRQIVSMSMLVNGLFLKPFSHVVCRTHLHNAIPGEKIRTVYGRLRYRYFSETD